MTYVVTDRGVAAAAAAEGRFDGSAPTFSAESDRGTFTRGKRIAWNVQQMRESISACCHV